MRFGFCVAASLTYEVKVCVCVPALLTVSPCVLFALAAGCLCSGFIRRRVGVCHFPALKSH